jgi:Rrf2 family protein
MLELALNYEKGTVSLQEVADKQEISPRYLEQIMASLKAAGLARSVRGAHGGYTLTKPPSQITLYDVIKVVEGSLAPVECVDDPTICHRSPACVTHEIWALMKGAIVELLQSFTLQDLADRWQKKEKLLAKIRDAHLTL